MNTKFQAHSYLNFKFSVNEFLQCKIQTVFYLFFLLCRSILASGLLAVYYEAEGGVLELLETGVPYAPHVKAKIT